MEEIRIRDLASGANQRGVRDHNGRLILSILQRHGALPGRDLARRTGLTAPAISTILRALERDGYIKRGPPLRGRVGKPSIPMDINPDGILSFGLKVGRRSADLLLLDVKGTVRDALHTSFDYPLPGQIFDFLREGLSRLKTKLSPALQQRIAGIGIAVPFELWRWHDLSGPAAEAFRAWRQVDFARDIARFTPLPVHVVNDATAACRAEHLYGRGKGFRDYAYFFIGSFIGGGIVMNNAVFEGNRGNAGALGSMRTTGPLGESRQLIDVASLHLLEARLSGAGLDPDILRHSPTDWSGLARYVDPWIGETAQELAKASLSICSVVDFEAILIDGAFPDAVRRALVDRVRRYLVNQDTRGLIRPVIEAGSIGAQARGIGAASGPIISQFLLKADAGLAST